MRYVIVALVCLVRSPEFTEAAKTLPEYVNLCKRSDPNLQKCWRDSLDALRPHLVKGIPELNIPAIDPLVISEISLNQEPRSSRIHFNAVLTNLQFSEGKNFEILDNHIDLDKITFGITLRFPHLLMTGDYKAKGRVLVFDFDSDGKAFGEFSNVEVGVSWTGSMITKKGKQYISLKEDDVSVKLGKMHLRFDNIIKDSPELTRNVNLAINENIDLLYQDFQPLLKKTLGTVITQFTNRAYRSFPADVLYPRE